MEQVQEQKKGKNGKIVALALALVILIGGTYAWLTLNLTGTKTVRIESGNLAMEIQNETNGITIDPAVPITETEGRTQDTKYVFELKNTGNVSSQYTVYLDDDGVLADDEFAISKSLVGYYLEKEIYDDSAEPAKVGTTITSGGTLNDIISNGYVVLDQSTTSLTTDEGSTDSALPAGYKIKYTLRLWITDEAGTDDLQKTVEGTTKLAAYQGRIGVKATQIGIEKDEAYNESAARTDTWVRPGGTVVQETPAGGE